MRSSPVQLAGLTLADGNTWGIAAADEGASAVVSRFAEVMQLLPHAVPTYRLLVLSEGSAASAGADHITSRERQASFPGAIVSFARGDTFTCFVPFLHDTEILAYQLFQLSLIIAGQAQTRGGFLLHGALVEKDGWGVILAGPGGVGKTTASRRLPAPWHALSDDEVLIVRDEKGVYKAHPWPTWSRLLSGGPWGSWNVNHAVVLKGILFLEQARHDRIEPIEAGHSVSLLVELAEQISWFMSHGLGKDKVRSMRLQRFENICDLPKSVPCYRLYLSLEGAFWEEIERVIAEEEKKAS